MHARVNLPPVSVKWPHACAQADQRAGSNSENRTPSRLETLDDSLPVVVASEEVVDATVSRSILQHIPSCACARPACSPSSCPAVKVGVVTAPHHR